VPWWFLKMSGDGDNKLTGWMDMRLNQLETLLSDREWLVNDRFTAADLLMADVLRVSDIRSFGERPATEAYIKRTTERPSFTKARDDQIAHFAASDPKS